MPNLSKLYSDAIRLESNDDRQQEMPSIKDPARIQAEINWQNSTITKQFFSSIEAEIIELEKQARNLAVSFPQHTNHNQIVQLLIRAAELRKLVDRYATRTDA